jgi:Protein of unknown function (DUF2800)
MNVPTLPGGALDCGTYRMSTTHRRASSLPRELACPASHVEPSEQLAIPLVNDGEDAATGSAAHQVVAGRITGQRIDDDVGIAAAQWKVDPEEVGMLSAIAVKHWREIERFFPSPLVEVSLGPEHMGSGAVLTGHADVISIDAGERQARIADWKFGRLDLDFTDQLRAYAWLALKKWPHLESAYAATIRVRAGEIDGQKWDRQELDQWAAESAAKLSVRAYNPGPHCRFCPRRLECPAIGAYLKQAATALEAADIFGLESSSRMGYLLDCIKVLEGVMEKAKSAIKDAVSAAGGRLETDDGRELVLSTQERRKIAASAKSKEILTGFGGMTEEEWYSVLTVGKTKVEEVVKSQAPRGSKGSAAKDVIDTLAEAGQLSTQYIEKLEIRRKAKTLTEVKQ